ncbi:MAG: hypothetical protein ABI600_11440 [Luteolibacter sp.]
MSPKKKIAPKSPTLAVQVSARHIRLRPSSSDYETFARTTALAMGKAEPTGYALKPNRLLLSLLNLGSSSARQ